jgi:hypothetical protein
MSDYMNVHPATDTWSITTIGSYTLIMMTGSGSLNLVTISNNPSTPKNCNPPNASFSVSSTEIATVSGYLINNQPFQILVISDANHHVTQYSFTPITGILAQRAHYARGANGDQQSPRAPSDPQ